MYVKLAIGWISVVVLSTTATGEPSSTGQKAPAPKTELLKPSVSVPLKMWGGRPTVQAKINGAGPFNLIVDTGTSFPAVLDDDLAKQAGLEVGDHVPSLGQVGEHRTFRVDRISLGEATFSNVEVNVADFGGFMPAGADIPQGILGLPLLESCLATFDYPNQKLILELGELSKVDSETFAYSTGEDDFGVTLELGVAGQTVRTHLDSGSPGFLTLLNKWAGKLPLLGEPKVMGRAASPSGAVEIRSATLKGIVKLGQHEFENPRINFADLGPMVDFDCGNIGHRFLKNFAFTIDQKNHRVRFRSKNADKNVP